MPITLHFRKGQKVQAIKLRRALEAALKALGKGAPELEVSLVGLKRIAHLNQRYLKHHGVTDVLSFPLDKRPVKARAWHLGEIVIALPVAATQAKRAGRKPIDQVIRLAIHGLVHLLGNDHTKSDAERRRFERLEKKYLTLLSRKKLVQWDGSLPF